MLRLLFFWGKEDPSVLKAFFYKKSLLILNLQEQK
jgi:hypothetical protein